MFRLSRYLHALRAPTEVSPTPPHVAAQTGPVVIWNLVRRCNLTCRHCYATSADKDFPGELTRPEIDRVMDDLHAYGVRVLILSGGEPLLHPDLFAIARRAKGLGFYVGLSSNGTLIDAERLAGIVATGFDYVGISLDGLRDTHDRIRRKVGAFDAALQGLHDCRAAGIKVGLRFTLTRDNAPELPDLLRLMDSEDIDKLYLSHLNYAGRGYRNRGDDPHHRLTREAMDLLFETCWADVLAGRRREFVTGNNDADGVYLLHWAARRLPEALPRLRAMLRRWGGNASGIAIANIDNEGWVHPDTMWWDYRLGNVKERSFGTIWEDRSDPLMDGLKRRPRPLEGRCATCGHLDICGGNTRTRAWRLTGNAWAEDPGCYLTDAEIAEPFGESARAMAPSTTMPGPSTETPARTDRGSRRAGMAAVCSAASLALLLGALLMSGPAPARADSPTATPPPVATLASPAAPAAVAVDVPTTYASLCAQCHGADRLGGMGPALIPETLGRLTAEEARATILAGRPATQMPSFEAVLDAALAERLAAWILTPLEETPIWDLERIGATHRRLLDPAELPARPVHAADPLNLFVVVELGDHHATILDGDRLEPIHRFQTHPALHGGPKFSPDGRFVYFASRNGWISKFDLYGLQPVAEIRAGINTRNLALSGDGRYVAVANSLPHTLVILDARDLTPLKLIPVADDNGRGSRVSAVYAAPPRQSFVAALKDIPEIWEIKLADAPLPVYNGPMHDYRLDEGTARQTGRFPIQRIVLDDYLDDFFFDPSYRLVLGAARDADQGQVVHLDARRKIADLDLAGMPHLGSGITWEYLGRMVLATPHLKESRVSVIDMTDWHTIARIETLGPGFFMRSHEATPYAWVDVFFGPHRDALHVIDKRSLKIVETLRPSPGLTAAHVEFDRYGQYALVSVSEPAPDGALVVYDAATLKEIKRLPMNKPSGKYNVYNKISGSTGTSH